MSRHETFMMPGESIALFIISILDLSPATVGQEWIWAMSLFFAAIAWLSAMKIIWALIKRVTGFDERRR